MLTKDELEMKEIKEFEATVRADERKSIILELDGILPPIPESKENLTHEQHWREGLDIAIARLKAR